jgi:hypothetical protein
VGGLKGFAGSGSPGSFAGRATLRYAPQKHVYVMPSPNCPCACACPCACPAWSHVCVRAFVCVCVCVCVDGVGSSLLHTVVLQKFLRSKHFTGKGSSFLDFLK